jgi:peptide-methionine (S)-S-oxide reductase
MLDNMKILSKTEIAIFGGGCFWCTEAVFSMFKGIIKVTPGYAGGVTENPSYEEVCNGNTGHAEVLEINYNPKIIGFDILLNIFFSMHDPTSSNKQGSDYGNQYRSIILYTNEKQHKQALHFIKKIQSNYKKPIVTEVRKLVKFYNAEDYHKNYYKNNPLQPYCILVINPKIRKLQEKFSDLLK